MNPFVLIVGPTASGKSSLALRLAETLGAGILNCDSLQAYRRLDVGTAKPSWSERQRVPHYLFDFLKPGEILTAGDFRRLALGVLERELPLRPVLGVGGSGFYIQALEKGMFALDKPKPEVDAQVRRDLERDGLAKLYEELREGDPEYAEELNPNDSYRIVRAVVILRDSGRKVSELKREFTEKTEPFPFPLLKLGLAPSREWLLPRIQQRTEQMLKLGFMVEVEKLLDEGWGEWPPMQSVGYKECVACLRGEVPFEKLPALISEKTIQLAKKQRTWFNRDKEIHWLNVDEPYPEALHLIEAAISLARS
jgi:tRNA dimethylallyltransferase